MRFDQRMFARLKFLDLMADLYENAFEVFFQSLMTARYPDFLDVRTAGSLGDQGADGLSIYGRSLYACYAPQTYNAAKVEEKFNSDLESALEKRAGEFDTFVFVHNDRRGMHPQITSLIVQVSQEHPGVRLKQMGPRALWREIMKLDKDQVEDLLGCPIPIEETIYGVGMDDLAPLLKHISERRKSSIVNMAPLKEVSSKKLAYNSFDEDSRRLLVEALRYTHLIDEYYQGSMDVREVDEVSAGFADYYKYIRQDWDDSEDIWWQMEMYILGNASHPPKVRRAAWVILAYFFERCDIFEDAPEGWMEGAV